MPSDQIMLLVGRQPFLKLVLHYHKNDSLVYDHTLLNLTLLLVALHEECSTNQESLDPILNYEY
ncbi:hypothetical protein SDC9_147559 [bioreactor metagenome]|uniref:Uncharacterized protein n=1 Tax=bioreactor metagenome TaxID=1076179 RepID=A0A645EE87_9ZZZZ